MGSDPKTEAGRRPDGTREFVAFAVEYLALTLGEESATVKAGRRIVEQIAIEEEAARLVSPADREGPWHVAAGHAWSPTCVCSCCEAGHHHAPADREAQVAGVAAALHKAMTGQFGLGDRPDLWKATAQDLYDAGLRLVQREDAPLDAARLAEAIPDAAAIAAEYQRLREAKP